MLLCLFSFCFVGYALVASVCCYSFFKLIDLIISVLVLFFVRGVAFVVLCVIFVAHKINILNHENYN